MIGLGAVSEHHPARAVHPRVHFALRAYGLTIDFCLRHVMKAFIVKPDISAMLKNGQNNCAKSKEAEDKNQTVHGLDMGTLPGIINYGMIFPRFHFSVRGCA